MLLGKAERAWSMLLGKGISMSLRKGMVEEPSSREGRELFLFRGGRFLISVLNNCDTQKGKTFLTDELRTSISMN